MPYRQEAVFFSLGSKLSEANWDGLKDALDAALKPLNIKAMLGGTITEFPMPSAEPAAPAPTPGAPRRKAKLEPKQ